MRGRGVTGPRVFLRDERGGVVWVAAAALTVLAASAAVAIDLGGAYVARSEAQRVADSSALAAAMALIETPGNTDRARHVATSLAGQNTVRGTAVALRSEDVSFEDRLVTVHVRRSVERGEGVDTWFARVFGVGSLDIQARARAAVVGASGATCLKPIIVPDLWHDANDNGRYDDGEVYSPHLTGYGTTFRQDAFVRDVGRPVRLIVGSNGTPIAPSWYFLLRIPGTGSQGGDAIRSGLANTNCDQTVVRFGDLLTVDQEPGNKSGPVRQGINDLIASDPNAYWDATTRTVRGSRWGDEAWRASTRIITIALFDPREPVQPGTRPVRITNFASVFLEGTVGGDVIGRFLTTVGVAMDHCETTQTCAPFASTVRLTE